MTDRKLSEFGIKRKECQKCGATWLNNVHYWRTGAKGSELDLAGLVCNQTDSSECINPAKARVGGDTWEKRAEFIEKSAQKLKTCDQ